MALFTVNYYRAAIYMHMFIGAYMYTNSSILSSSNIHYLSQIEKWIFHLLGAEENHDHPFLRFGNGIGLLYFMFIILVAGLMIIRNTH